MHVLLGITGSIAAYKSCEILRQFQQHGHKVKVIMTDASQQFITSKTFEGLTEDQVYTSNWFTTTKGNAHIHLARWADVFIIAPATAHSLYKCAYGKADDLLSNVYLAFDKKTFFAPAMNTQMLEDASVQNSLAHLTQKGDEILDVGSGELACKEIGLGKMMEPEDIFKTVIKRISNTSKLFGKKILLTAGATREYIDPVRYISSPSTGLMGILLAQEALERGAKVTLVSGPTDLPYKGEMVKVTSADEMFESTQSFLPCDIFVGAAAVADYKPLNPSKEKIKKTNEDITLTCTKNPDILSYVSQQRSQNQFIVGFAAETNNIIEHAKTKLKSKELDMIVANQVHQEKMGFGNTQNTYHMITSKSIKTEENCSKEEFAKVFWNHIESHL
ncbi:MAG: bifunctional phosphopantothenoylcysteine decarboxylase/phosphopantothenate--cysteine ligase CoaBC [Bdellovibrionales bacterium]|nr:bifunctional phosphopantothenoylcysteine decarboxylase/phosphopantothenate--cysteine ligase CoaBC [Bdellovibrionales bacterium]